MASEPLRACGYRKRGRLYLTGSMGAMGCCKLPIALPKHFCSGCGLDHTVDHYRGWGWLNQRPLLLRDPCSKTNQTTDEDEMRRLRETYGAPWRTLSMAAACPAADPEQMGEKVGMLWIGKQYYKTAEAFVFEADTLGISRHIKFIPHGFKLGDTWVFLAHVNTIRAADGTWSPGIFHMFRPERIEYIVSTSEMADTAAMDKLRARDITPVAVPDRDRSHVGLGKGADKRGR